MAYHVYTTEAIILKRVPYGETNVLVHVLTRDLGLIFVAAQGVRTSASKLSSGLTEFTYATISVIKGKNGWKATSVIAKENFFWRADAEGQRIMAQVRDLVLYMIPGEEPHLEIFQAILSGFDFLKGVSDADMPLVESLLVIRILYHLGYVVKNTDTEMILNDTNEWSETLLATTRMSRPTLVRIINRGLTESQLTS